MMFPDNRRRPQGSSAMRSFGMFCSIAGVILLAFSGACASVTGRFTVIGLVGGILLVLGSTMWVQAGGRTGTLLWVLIWFGAIIGFVTFVFVGGLGNMKLN